MHAVVALELRVVRHGVEGSPVMLVVVHVQVIRLVIQREKEEIAVGTRGEALTRAAHVR